MKRILLLCFLHGFKGDDDTFGDFPQHLQDTVTNNLPDHKVASVVYPKYETKGELGQSTEAFLGWLKERVMDLRKEHLEKPWPPNDRSVGVILVAHSMGGFVASDCLFRILDERRRDGNTPGPIFPLVQGILAFDTPYNGLARSMFVYGAFSNYQKVSNVFNVMTALSAAAPAGLARLAAKRTAATSAASAATRRTSSPAWKAWQLIAVRTGTVGAIAAGGVAAYMHRRQILDSVRSVRGLKREHVVQGYQQSVDALGQGLAYVNRGNVGASFAWLADHFTFVGALLKQNELNRRLERLASLRGVGVRDFYASLGENGVWSGGYFVPERTFCAVPVSASDGENSEQVAREAALFSRHVIPDATDEIVAHMSLFKPDRNADYERMTSEAAQLVVAWFGDDAEVYDDPKFAEPAPAESVETEILAKAVGEGSASTTEAGETEAVPGVDVDESPIDIAAAASLVPLPDGSSGDLKKGDADADADAEKQKQAYLAHLLAIAQSTGTNLRSYLPPLPAGVARVSLPSVSMPSMPSIPSMPAMPTMPSMSMPRVGGLFSKKAPAAAAAASAAASESAETRADLAAAGTSLAAPAPAAAAPSATATVTAAASGEQDKDDDDDGAKPDGNAASVSAAPS
ncbi:hypothetical protein B0T24DRAFT_647739 [Lasiosphaeria ovina]|uniref:DUF676 domain-containing protein n=1 Tax=Lasiosphaeria ovina TaxID=92902 RepID=A0AAE0TUN3_9PEZI|nr:hypothetical protein B0T24DRAFT_647739 [Lasiosphaeria ovina]